MAKTAEETSKRKRSLKKAVSAKKRKASSEPRQEVALVKKKAALKKAPTKTLSPTKTAAKQKSPKAPINDTPSSKARKHQQFKNTPYTQEVMPSTGGLARLKTSVVHEIFGEQIKFSPNKG